VPRLGDAFSRAIAAVLAAVALTGLGVLAARPDSEFEGLIPRRALVVAAALAAKNPSVRILGDEWSSPPLLWLHPATFGRVAFDVRFEQYPTAVLDSYARFLSDQGHGWQRLMRGYDIVVVSRQLHARVAGALLRLPGWRVAYSSRDGLVLERGLRPPGP
jgi:hypothetical protein